MAETKITVNEIDGSVKSKVLTGTRDAAAVSGDVAYTGLGFTPTSVHLLLNVDATLYNSRGYAASDKTSRCIYQSAANVNYVGSFLGAYTNYTSWGQSATIKSYDADGFTLTWTKNGTPTAGTIQLMFICYR